jgi:hypothetical protein
MKAVEQAIAESIATDGAVVIAHSPAALQALIELCGFYTVVHGGFQFDGGDEMSRNDWTVILRKA